MSPNCSHEDMIKMPSGVIKCAKCGAIDIQFYGSWWADVFDWAKPKENSVKEGRNERRINHDK